MIYTLAESSRPTILATIVKVSDADTYWCDVPICATGRRDGPVGFGLRAEHKRIVLRTKIRLAGYNAAEHDTPGGDAATAYVTGLLPVGMPVRLEVKGADEYGQRWLASVGLPDGRDLGVFLYGEGWVSPYDGRGPKPVPPFPPVPRP